MVACEICQKRSHEICAKFLEEVQKHFICDHCRLEYHIAEDRKVNASSLPKTRSTIAIQQYLSEILTDMKGYKLRIRLISEKHETTKTRPWYKKEVKNIDCRFKTRFLMVFLTLPDQSDVCMFGIYLQMFGPNCGHQPNDRSVYLAYLDSVELLTQDPKFRTTLYKSILLAVCQDLKNCGEISF